MTYVELNTFPVFHNIHNSQSFGLKDLDILTQLLQASFPQSKSDLLIN